MEHVKSEELRELFERSGLTPALFAKLFNYSERAFLQVLGSVGILLGQSWRIEQFKRIKEAVAQAELKAIQKLTPFVAFNSPKLKETVASILLSGSGGSSAYGDLVVEGVRANSQTNGQVNVGFQGRAEAGEYPHSIVIQSQQR